MIENLQTKSQSRRLFIHQHVKAGFLHMFGTHSIFSLFLVCITLISLNWFGNTFWDVLIDRNILKPLKVWIGFLSFPLIMVSWYLSLQKSFKETGNLSIHEYSLLPGCRVLIVFLSLPTVDIDLVDDYLSSDDTKKESESILSLRSEFKRGWRMPLEAIAYHVEKNTLESVIVIPSADTPSTEEKKDGTFRIVGKFIQLFQKSKNIEVLHAGEIKERWMEGVNYESARDLRDCLNDLYTWLRQKQYADDDIIVDITSGQKVCASVASVMSLAIGRQVQYVSTHDYTIRTYNISYESN